MNVLFKIIVFYILSLLEIGSCTCLCRLYQITQPVDHAEGPSWDNRKQMLYFVDIHAGNVYAYNYKNKVLSSIHLNGEVTPVIQSKRDPNLLIVGLNRTVTSVNWDGQSKNYRSTSLTTVSPQYPTSRFNDGKADKQGRLWLGTMGFEDARGVAPNQGVLYKVTRQNLQKPDVMIAPVNVSNGLVWNKANDKFYYIDTPTRQIQQFDYKDSSGEITNGGVIFDLANFPSVKGYPDGMTIDKNDNLWVALYNGGAVINVDPKNGHLLKIVKIPADAVTSVVWGGPKLDILYITTSRFRLNKTQRMQQPLAGSVFALKGLGINGVDIFEADII